MNIAVIPIGKTSIDWSNLIKSTNESLGRSITKSLDRHHIKPATLSAFIAALGELKKPDSDPIDMIRNPGALARHVSYSVLLAADKRVIIELIESSSLSILSTGTNVRQIRLAYISGTLEQWFVSIINGCSSLSSKELRLFYDHCLIFIEKDGFAQLWSDYRRVVQPDKTFLLERRGV